MRDPLAEAETVAVGGGIGRALLFITVSMVLFCGMFPFDFTFSSATALRQIHDRFDMTVHQLWTAGDGGENVIFFLPFGFAIGAVLWRSAIRRKPVQIILRVAAAVLLSVCLSTTVELSQVFLVSRDPSLSDVTCNTIGGTLGFLIYAGIGTLLMRPLTRWALAARRVLDARAYLIAAAGWTALLLSMPLMAGGFGSLAEWGPAFPLMVGNETTNDRGWKGTIQDLWLLDRALPDDELERVLGGAPPDVIGDHTVAVFRFTGKGPYDDQTGHGSPLIWTALPSTPRDTAPGEIAGADVSRGPGAPITWAWWLRTAEGGVAIASHRIARSNAFTLVADVSSADLAQCDRQPRIISISAGTTLCNLQLIQDFDKLVVRLRSIDAGDGGTHPECAAPGIFTDGNPRRIVVSYDNGRLLVACDRAESRYSVHFTPESSLIWRIYPRPGWRYRMDSPGEYVAGLLYRALVFVPLGLLFGARLWVAARGRMVRIPDLYLPISGLLAAAILLEAILHFCCGEALHASYPLASVIAGGVGVLAIAHGWRKPRLLRSRRTN